MTVRRFNLVDGTSDKFWQITVDGVNVTVNYGRNGTNGQTKTKSYPSADAAATDAAKQITSKVAKGYVEEGLAGDAVPAVAQSAAPTKTTPVKEKKQPAPSVTVVEPPAPDFDLSSEPVGDLGLILTRTEAAAIAGGEPLDSYEVPESTVPLAEMCKQYEAFAKAHMAYRKASRGWLVFPPFDGIPDRATAAWWEVMGWGAGYPDSRESWGGDPVPFTIEQLHEAIESGLGRFYTVTVKQAQLFQWAKDAAGDLSLRRPLIPWRAGYLAPETKIAIRVALDGVDATFDRVFMGHEDRYTFTVDEVAGLRALLLPQLSREQLAAAGAIARDEGVDIERRILLSSVVLPPDEHTEFVMGIDPQTWTGRQQIFVPAAAMAMADQGARDELNQRVEEAEAIAAKKQWHYTYSQVPSPVELAVLPSWRHRIVTGLKADLAEDQPSEAWLLLGRLTGVGAVRLALEIVAETKATAVAKDWLLSHPQLVAEFAEPLRADSILGGHLYTIARELLASVPNLEARHPIVIQAATDLHAENSLPVLGTDAPYPQWWTEAVDAEAAAEANAVKMPKKQPAWLAAVTGLIVDDARLPETDLHHVIVSAAASGGNEDLSPRPLIAAVRQRMTQAARDKISLALLRGWLAAGAPAGERCYFQASGFLGAQEFVAELAGLVAEWPGQSQHARAVLGLDILAATGEKAALGAISGIANKSKFKGVKEAAGKSLERLAALQNLTRHQLEDQVIPDGGLDAGGRKILDFGPRQFRLGITALGKVSVRELDAEGRPTGASRTALPAPNSKDDHELAKAAKAEFSQLKKSIADVAKIQTVRLGQAMVLGREWSFGDHRELYAGHPLMNALIQPLVWTVRDGEHDPVLVRVDEAGDYLTVDEEPVVFADGAVVTLAHPLFLAEQDKAAWRQHLDDHELVAPIEQLDRAIFGLPEGQPAQAELLEVPQGVLNPGTMLSTLEREGWIRSTPQDAGVMVAMLLPYPDFDFTVAIELTGLYTGYIQESEPQEVCSVQVQRGLERWYYGGRSLKDYLPWTEIPLVVVSEVRRVLAILQEKMGPLDPNQTPAPPPGGSGPSGHGGTGTGPAHGPTSSDDEDEIDPNFGFATTIVEWAGLPEGQPLDTYQPAQLDGDGDAVADLCEHWCADNMPGFPREGSRRPCMAFVPFEGVPDPRMAAWWEAHSWLEYPVHYVNGEETLYTAPELAQRPEMEGQLPTVVISAEQRAQWAREAAKDPVGARRRVRIGDPRQIGTPEMWVGIWLALDGVTAVAEELVQAAQDPILREAHKLEWTYGSGPRAMRVLDPELVLGYRALLIPQMTAEQTAILAAAARDTNVNPRCRIVLSALALEPAEHTELIFSCDADLFYSYDIHEDLGSRQRFIAGAINMTDEDRERFLESRLEAEAADPVPSSFTGNPLLPTPIELLILPNQLSTSLKGIMSASVNEAKAEAWMLTERFEGLPAVEVVLGLLMGWAAHPVAKNWLLARPRWVAAFDDDILEIAEPNFNVVARELAANDPSFTPRHPVAIRAAEEVRREESLPELGSDGDWPSWWHEAVAAEEAAGVGTVKVPTRPRWWVAVPPVMIDQHRLSASASEQVLASAIRSSGNDDLAPRPLIAAVRERMTPEHRDQLANVMVRSWLVDGADDGQRCYFQAAGFFGSKGFVATWAPWVSDWPTINQTARAVMGVSVLASTGEMSALRTLSILAHWSEQQSVKVAVSEAIEKLAAVLQLSRDELEDQLIFDSDLDDDGVALLDFGARKFHMVQQKLGEWTVREVDADGRPVGQPLSALPKPVGDDDPELARTAESDFTRITNEVAEVVTVQTERLNQAMMSGRSWPVAVHRTCFVDHVVMNLVIRGLVFSVTPATGGSLTLVRVGDDRDYLTADGEVVTPADDAVITLVHPQSLSADDLQTWRQVLHDHDLVPALPQLDADQTQIFHRH